MISSLLMNVEVSSTRPMTIASCRMTGNRSGTRSARSGLMNEMTSPLMSAAASASFSNARSCPSVVALNRFGAAMSSRLMAMKIARRKTDSRSLRLTSRLIVRLMIPSVTASAATPRIN
ncbi:MAG: hypothetical protein DMF84_09735 [Acidobacteria bacterium]|nr:MAG: hypothetical protein DMF84_09735 [Acidobacteriota bacterium]